MAAGSQQKKYGLDIRRHSSHSRRFPWMALIKILIGTGIVLLTWYLAENLFQEPPVINEGDQPHPEIELEF